MTWHLKDRALEEKLNELVGNNQFTEALNRECTGIQSKKVIVVKFGENTGHVKGSFRCYLDQSELMNVGYDPHQWNSYPEVTPPENVLMRVECDGNMHTALIYKGNRWQFESGEDFHGFERIYKVKRFRPWED